MTSPEWIRRNRLDARGSGLRDRSKRRYAMVYRHEPGRASVALSADQLFQIARGALDAFNAVLGGLGNKLTVQAVRRAGG